MYGVVIGHSVVIGHIGCIVASLFNVTFDIANCYVSCFLPAIFGVVVVCIVITSLLIMCLCRGVEKHVYITTWKLSGFGSSPFRPKSDVTSYP